MIMKNIRRTRVREMMLCLAHQGYSTIWWFSKTPSTCFQLHDIMVCEKILQSEINDVNVLADETEEQDV